MIRKRQSHKHSSEILCKRIMKQRMLHLYALIMETGKFSFRSMKLKKHLILAWISVRREKEAEHAKYLI